MSGSSSTIKMKIGCVCDDEDDNWGYSSYLPEPSRQRNYHKMSIIDISKCSSLDIVTGYVLRQV